MLNTMDETALADDPLRHYLLPRYSDRDRDWVTHPAASRDSLHEAAMWAVEGLTHRYPTKVLAELVTTCPQYCGHCTRMDLVGSSTAQIHKQTFRTRLPERYAAMLAYISARPRVRDVVVSGGDIANVPMPRLEAFVNGLLDIPHVRDIRLAAKSLIGLPQHFLEPEVLAGLGRLASRARRSGVSLALHTHANHANQITPLVAEASRRLLEIGIRDVRNQGVLLRGVNASTTDLLDLSFALLDRAGITPYYVYMCDMIPNAEHWRTTLLEAQGLQHSIMGYLPGYATPRIVCDVPLCGKLWVHQADRYDQLLGISYWSKNYRTPLDPDDTDLATVTGLYFDPVSALPEEGQQWWRERQAPPRAG
jgi:lysine 2,3-aminomutase